MINQNSGDLFFSQLSNIDFNNLISFPNNSHLHTGLAPISVKQLEFSNNQIDVSAQ